MRKPEPVSKKELFDLFVTALEDGIDYWADIKKYHWKKKNNYDVDLDGYFAIITITDDDIEEGKELRIDEHTIRTGLERIRGGGITICEQVKNSLISLDYDADGADCVVQVGLFGEIRYA